MRDHPTESVGMIEDACVSSIPQRLPSKRPLKRPKDMRPAGPPTYSLRSGDLMLTQDHAPAIAEEVSAALATLLVRRPSIIKGFEETFHQRSKMAGLVESHLGYEGIEGALAELFPNKFRINHLKGSSEGKSEPETQFINDCQRAIRMLAEKDPLALLMLKRNQLKMNCTLEDALEALFSIYSQHAAVYPY
jgi:hypothetical protein